MPLQQHKAQLEQKLQQILPTAGLREYTLPVTASALVQTPLRLYLLDDCDMHRPLNEAETAAAWEDVPYWLFCWASGLALAQWLFEQPQIVRGKTVLDMGAGSGVVAIAAALAGASSVVACDIDPLSCAATTLNADLNHIELEVVEQVGMNTVFDLVFAADVLYDSENHTMLDCFKQWGETVYVADSRVKTMPRAPYGLHDYQETDEREAVTLPDLGELEMHKRVKFFKSS